MESLLTQAPILYILAGIAATLFVAWRFNCLKKPEREQLPASVVHHVIHKDVEGEARDGDEEGPPGPTHRTQVVIPFEIAITPLRPAGNPAKEFGFGAKEKAG